MERKKELFAYCGLYCGDCAGFSGEVAGAANNLKNILTKYKFERTANALFSKELKEYDKFCDMLQFITTLKCEAICRERADDTTTCKIRKCCRNKGFYACYECKIYKKCEKLKTLDDLHGDSYLKNFKAIKSMGIDTWLNKGKRYWFGNNTDD
jgi:hypothetical protein